MRKTINKNINAVWALLRLFLLSWWKKSVLASYLTSSIN